VERRSFYNSAIIATLYSRRNKLFNGSVRDYCCARCARPRVCNRRPSLIPSATNQRLGISLPCDEGKKKVRVSRTVFEDLIQHFISFSLKHILLRAFGFCTYIEICTASMKTGTAGLLTRAATPSRIICSAPASRHRPLGDNICRQSQSRPISSFCEPTSRIKSSRHNAQSASSKKRVRSCNNSQNSDLGNAY
jgi:hypothetical protein